MEIQYKIIYSTQIANDQSPIVQDYEDLEYMTRKLREDYEMCGLKLNIKNYKYCHRRHIKSFKTRRWERETNSCK